MSTLTQHETETVPGDPGGEPAVHPVGYRQPATTPAPSSARRVRMARAALWALLLVTIAGVIGWKLIVPRPSNLPVLFPAAHFTLTDQDAKAFSSDDLRGRPWIAAFIFTTCGQACPRMTTTMASLQKQLPADVPLVSFSVDPGHDTPAELKKYAALYHADESRWRFLTGPNDKVMEVIAAMKLAFAPAERESPILHSEKLLLVDAEGQVRGDYRSNEPEEMKQLAADAAVLEKDAKRGKLMKWLSQTGTTAGAPGATGGAGGKGGGTGF